MARKRGRRGGRGVLLFLLLAAGVGAVLLYLRRPDSAPPEPRTQRPVAASPPAPAEPPPLPAPAPVAAGAAREPVGELPRLEESDALVRELVRTISSHPRIAASLVNDALIRRAVVAVSNLAEGRSPTKHLSFLAPDRDFAVRAEGSELRIAPESYRRYDSVAEAFASLDTRGTVQLYRDLRPLFQEAYAELGYPEGNFDGTLREAGERLLETPVLDDAPQVTEDILTYVYSDPELERLDDAQRHLLRMGPRNVRLIQGKLGELLAELDRP